VEVAACGRTDAELAGEGFEPLAVVHAGSRVPGFEACDAPLDEALEHLGQRPPGDIQGHRVREHGNAAARTDCGDACVQGDAVAVDVERPVLAQIFVEGLLSVFYHLCFDQKLGEVRPADGAAVCERFDPLKVYVYPGRAHFVRDLGIPPVAVGNQRVKENYEVGMERLQAEPEKMALPRLPVDVQFYTWNNTYSRRGQIGLRTTRVAGRLLIRQTGFDVRHQRSCFLLSFRNSCHGIVIGDGEDGDSGGCRVAHQIGRSIGAVGGAGVGMQVNHCPNTTRKMD